MNLTFAEVCEFLNIGETKLRELIAGGFIPAGKLGRKWIIRQQDVLVYRDELIYKRTLQQGRKRTPKAYPDLSGYGVAA
ncbi:MAG: helix-turn-helix domain-containing protein [Sideroxydans sp.]|nr:helix-turn-helix domain-containing protein [Sideroxydans sp.]